jgi:hypothetical protein
MQNSNHFNSFAQIHLRNSHQRQCFVQKSNPKRYRCTVRIMCSGKTKKAKLLPCPMLARIWGAMLSEGWCVAKSDASNTIACPFYALEFDQDGSTVLPGSSKSTKSLFRLLKFRLLKNNALKLIATVVQQDADILSELYADSPQQIKLNN